MTSNEQLGLMDVIKSSLFKKNYWQLMKESDDEI